MVKNLLYLAAAAIILGGCISIQGCVSVQETTHVTEQKPRHVMRHVVLFKFKEGTTAEDVRKIESDFCALPSKIDAIQDFEWGTDIGTQNLSQGFTHCFVVTFLNEADRDKYLPHPAHKEFAELLRPQLDKVLVVDYWTK
jgi:hypothetical protein